MAWDAGGGGRERARARARERSDTKVGKEKERKRVEEMEDERGRRTEAPENSNKLSFAVQYSFRPHNNPARRWHRGHPEKILIQSGKCGGLD